MSGDASSTWPAFRGAAELALENIFQFGDTDILPVPFEINRLKADRDAALSAIERLHDDFDSHLARGASKPLQILSPSTDVGYRLASQLDPLLNVYYLALVIAAGAKIEALRSPISNSEVFSYRFRAQADTGRIFDTSGWRGFTEAIDRECARNAYVMETDIADFYHRMRWPLLERGMIEAQIEQWIICRLSTLLRAFDIETYGLPVGGPASRLLAELALVDFDHALHSAQIPFCRYVDDLKMFFLSRSQAEQAHYFAAELLWRKGLSLQKSKTRIVTTSLFQEEIRAARSMAPARNDRSGQQSPPFHLDPPAAIEDPYADLHALRDAVQTPKEDQPYLQLLLERELEKTRPHLKTLKSILKALVNASEPVLERAVCFILENAPRRSVVPVFGRLSGLLEISLSKMTGSVRHRVRDALLYFLTEDPGGYFPPLVVAQALGVLARLPPPPNLNRGLTAHLGVDSRDAGHPLVTRQLLFLLAYWGRHDEFCRIVRNQLTQWGEWEKRALEDILTHYPDLLIGLSADGSSSILEPHRALLSPLDFVYFKPAALRVT
jgi:hypothetical protein